MALTKDDLLKEAKEILPLLKSGKMGSKKQMPSKEIGDRINKLIFDVANLSPEYKSSLPQISELDDGINGLMSKTMRSFSDLRDDVNEIISILNKVK